MTRNKRVQAEAALQKGQPEKAAKLLEKWLLSEPADLKVRRQLGDLYREMGQPKDAIRHLEALAGGHAAAGLLLRAIATCKAILDLDPEHTETQHALADLYAKKRGGTDATASLPPMMASALRPPPPPQDDDDDDGSGELELDDDDIVESGELLAGIGVPNDTLPVQAAEVLSESTDDGHAESARALGADLQDADVLEVGDASIEVVEEVLDLGQDISLGALDDLNAFTSGEGSIESLDVAGIDLAEGDDARDPSKEGSAALAQSPDPFASGRDDASVDVLLDLDALALHDELDGSASVSTAGLPNSPLFSDLSRGAFEALVQQLDFRRVYPEAVIVQEGDPGESFFIIVRGEVRVERATEAPHLLGTLGEGDFFGEIAIIADAPRSASVIAERPTELLEVSRSVVERIGKDHPSLLKVLRKFCRQRLLENLVRSSPLLSGLDQETRAGIIAAFKPTSADAGEDIIRAGETSKALFIVISGSVSVTAPGIRRSLGAGDVFGEMGLFFDEPAAATVCAEVPCQLLRLSGKAFQRFCAAHPHLKARLEKISIDRAAENDSVDLIIHPHPTV